MRRLAASGIAVVLARRGASDGGAIYIRIDLTREATLVLRPAIAALGLDAATDDADRRFAFARGPEPCPPDEADAYLARQLGYDADAWIVAVDDPRGRHLLDDAITAE